MREDFEQRTLVNRRSFALFGLKGLLVAAVAGRLYEFQVVDAARYQRLSNDNRISIRPLPPRRGLIVDRFGKGLAVNRPTYQLIMIPEQTGDVGVTLERIATLIDLDDSAMAKVLRKTGVQEGFIPVTVRQNLSWQEVARIEVNLPVLPGIVIETVPHRHYPFADLVAHVSGYVGEVSQAELDGDKVLRFPGFRTGKTGIEKVYEHQLRGTPGTRQVEVNAVGRVIREIDRREDDPGSDIRLTIDMALQEFAVRRMENQTGSVVVLDALNGDVLTLASVPSFDPNVFNFGLTGDAWQAMLNDPRSPLLNKPVAGQYPPASTFKMMVALAALEAGAVTPATTVHCPGSFTLGDRTFRCWRHWGHGDMTLVDALKESCDVYFYEVAHLIGVDRIAAMARRFGLGETTGIELTGERAGLIPSAAWKRAVYGEPWYGGDTVNVGIGQGDVLTTPLQLAVMTARIANGLFRVTPRLVRQPVGPEVPGFAGLDVDSAHLRVVRQGMIDVVNNADGGTAYQARIRDEGMEMAGKTGTSQVRRLRKEEREGRLSQEDVPWAERDHGLFVGYAPLDEPRYVAAAIVDHGGSGSGSAAPVVRDVLREAQRRQSVRWNTGDDPSGQAEGTA